MIIDRYYYHQLNNDEKKIYKIFYDGVMEHKDIIPIPMKGLPSQEFMDNVFFALTRDNPLIYFLNQSAFNYAQDDSGNVAIVPQYFFNKDIVKEYNRKIEETVNGLAAQLNLTDGTDYEKELKIHDWICQNVDYDEKGHNPKNVAKFILSHNIIGVFAHHKAQCEGIAKAAKVLLNAVDIKCIVATGKAVGNDQNGPHAWNIVKIDDKPYHVDMTWDIGSNQGKAANKISGGRVYYDYFNITDAEISKNHTMEKQLPVCDSTDMNYFRLNNIIFKSKAQAIKHVEKELLKGNTEFYFRIEGRTSLKSTYKEVREVIYKYCNEHNIKGLKIWDKINDCMKTIWIRLI
ncbi:Transglutaminase-like superfamily protein [Lachnospiraceae bacterium NE2001]|nr:Transglutaminase-like superfamily protein [Lachnospiraceae bacterium NE2001]